MAASDRLRPRHAHRRHGKLRSAIVGVGFNTGQTPRWRLTLEPSRPFCTQRKPHGERKDHPVNRGLRRQLQEGRHRQNNLSLLVVHRNVASILNNHQLCVAEAPFHLFANSQRIQRVQLTPNEQHWPRMAASSAEEGTKAEPRHAVKHSKCRTGHAALHEQLPYKLPPEVVRVSFLETLICFERFHESLAFVPTGAHHVRRERHETAPQTFQQVVRLRLLGEEARRRHCYQPHDPVRETLSEGDRYGSTQAEASHVHKGLARANVLQEFVRLLNEEIEVVPTARATTGCAARAAG
mmetsp:Transcript_13982/g.38135  ORF Transcript_13982/g.38135 Transcript_13982/m.38135 type:complete len:295 (+) Transcript_13982:460-1344(+)